VATRDARMEGGHRIVGDARCRGRGVEAGRQKGDAERQVCRRVAQGQAHQPVGVERGKGHFQLGLGHLGPGGGQGGGIGGGSGTGIGPGSGSGIASPPAPPPSGPIETSKSYSKVSAIQFAQRLRYPHAALEAGIEGDGRVTFVIRRNGKIVRWAIEASTGNAMLDAEMRRAAGKLDALDPVPELEPGQVGIVHVTVNFHIDQPVE
ncbi:MAG: TonB family protein, partial [Rhodobacteraceae bacterium]|nr:TonB family protein [Paracoccaceae bacterium]